MSANSLAHGNPFWIASALLGCGRTFSEFDPDRALTTFRQGLLYTREHRLPFWEARIARDDAGLEAVHGDLNQSLALLDATIDSFHRAGEHATLAIALANLTVLFDRIKTSHDRCYGLRRASTDQGSIIMVTSLPRALDHLRAVLGETTFDDCVATGAAMEPATPSVTPATRSNSHERNS